MMKWFVVSVVLCGVCVSCGSLGEPSDSSEDRSGTVVRLQSSDTAGEHRTSITVEIEGLPPGETCRSLHLSPARGHVFPRLAIETTRLCSETAEEPDQTWVVERRAGWIQIRPGEGLAGSGLGNGAYTFDLSWSRATREKARVRSSNWAATRDSLRAFPKGEERIIFEDGPEGSPGIGLPQLRLSLHHDEDALVRIGGTTSLVIDATSSLAGCRYAVRCSTLRMDDHGDARGIGIDLASPVPATWGLVFRQATGRFPVDGSPASLVEIEAPHEPALAGRTFQAVLVVEDEAGEVLLSSVPITIGITG